MIKHMKMNIMHESRCLFWIHRFDESHSKKVDLSKSKPPITCLSWKQALDKTNLAAIKDSNSQTGATTKHDK